MKGLFAILLICLGHVSDTCYAQANQYILQSHFNGENGLPQNTIRDIAFSNSGFMWIATEDGLVRFDGKHTEIYNSQNTPLKKNRITQLIKTNDGKLYCLTEAEYLYEIRDTSPIISVRFLLRMPPIGFSAFHLFAASDIENFVQICKLIPLENHENDSEYPVFIAKKGSRIIIRYSDGILIYSKEHKLLRKIKIVNQYQNDFFVSDERLFMFDAKGRFYEVDTETGRLQSCKIQIEGIHSDQLEKNAGTNKLFWNGKTGDIYWASGQELFAVSVEKSTIILNKIISDLPYEIITNITTDQQRQHIIIGTWTNGYYIFRKKQFSNILSPDPSNCFYSQLLMPDSSTVLTGNMNVLGENTCYKIPGLGKYDFNSLCTDGKNNIWISSGPVLENYNLSTKELKKVVAFEPSSKNLIYLIYYNNVNSLLFANGTSLYDYKIGGTYTKLADFNFKVEQKQPYCLVKEGDSTIWIGTHGGIYQYKTSTKTMKLAFLDGIITRSLFKTSSGLMLAGTYGNGIYAIKNNRAIPLPLDKNEHLKSAHAFMEDKNGTIWISSNSGLFKIAQEEIVDFVAGKNKSRLFYYRYSTTDGLLTNEFNGGCFPPAIAVNEHTWSFPGMQGLVWFQPDSLKTILNNAGIYIDKLLLNDTAYQVPDIRNIFTQTHDFKLSIFLSSPLWSDDNNLQIEYQIKGDSTSKWILLKDITTPIILQNLSGGQHELVIRKRTGLGADNYTELRLSILVPRLLYEYTWFWPLAVLISGILIYGINRVSNYSLALRKKKLEDMVNAKTMELSQLVQVLEDKNLTISLSEEKMRKENELKSNLLFLLSHDIATPLRFINLFLSGFTKPVKPIPVHIEDLVDIKIAAGNLENLLHNIVTWLKSMQAENSAAIMQPIDLSALLREKLKLFELVIKKKNLTISNHVPAGSLIETDPLILSSAIQNLLGNAINYTANGTIDIDFAASKGHYKIVVTDNGEGCMNTALKQVIAPPAQDCNLPMTGYGIGLKVTGTLLGLIRGKLLIQQRKEAPGTIAVIWVQKGICTGSMKHPSIQLYEI